MLDIAKATKILEHHFATVTPDEFAKNLREFCPKLFEDEQGSSLDTEPLSNEEIYRKVDRLIRPNHDRLCLATYPKRL